MNQLTTVTSQTYTRIGVIVGVWDSFTWRLSGQISMILILSPIVYNINLGFLAFINRLKNAFYFTFPSSLKLLLLVPLVV